MNDEELNFSDRVGSDIFFKTSYNGEENRRAYQTIPWKSDYEIYNQGEGDDPTQELPKISVSVRNLFSCTVRIYDYYMYSDGAQMWVGSDTEEEGYKYYGYATDYTFDGLYLVDPSYGPDEVCCIDPADATKWIGPNDWNEYDTIIGYTYKISLMSKTSSDLELDTQMDFSIS